MISASRQVGYIHEPFKPTVHRGLNPNPFPHWYQYVCPENQEDYQAVFQDILKFRYHLASAFSHARGLTQTMKCARLWSRSLLLRLRRPRPLIKDPIALLSSEWLSQTFPIDVIVLIRHPAAFVSSLKVKGWNWDFREFLSQPLLMRDHLGPFLEAMIEMNQPQHSLVERAALLWKCLYHVVNRFRQTHADWLFVRHEDLSRDPIAAFRPIFQHLQLEYTLPVQQVIRDFSGAHNPSEKGQAKAIRRYSRGNIQNWKKRLTAEEIECVRQLTNGVVQQFYGEDEW